MEIYSAISDFNSPDPDGTQNILSFKKGDTFEIFDCNKTGEWWGARAVNSDIVGYVPSKYMKFEERKIGRLLPDEVKTQREETIQRITEMQSADNHVSPDDKYDIPEPEPDYNDDEVDSVQALVEPVIIRTRGPSETEKRLSDPDIENSELIKPRKISNPCLASKERMQLHKELLQNYKIGKNVLEKPELTKILDQRKEKQRIQEWEAQKKAEKKRTSLEYKLEVQATKLKEQEETMKPIKEEQNPTELSKIQAKILNKANGKVK